MTVAALSAVETTLNHRLEFVLLMARTLLGVT